MSSLTLWSLMSVTGNFTQNREDEIEDHEDADSDCDLGSDWSISVSCEFVKNNSDACEGGGYLLWTNWVVCEESTPIKIVIIGGAVLLLVVLFIAMSTAADDFFSTNVAAIIEHLQITENIAGVTFMAFGNGAPDIFSALASVLSTSQPKAGLAIGALIGAGIFVTTTVSSAIVLVAPFNVMRRPIMRDIGVYLIALAFIVLHFIISDNLYWWQPVGYLVIYAIYAGTVIFGRMVNQRIQKRNTVHAEEKQRERTVTIMMINDEAAVRQRPALPPITIADYPPEDRFDEPGRRRAMSIIEGPPPHLQWFELPITGTKSRSATVVTVTKPTEIHVYHNGDAIMPAGSAVVDQLPEAHFGSITADTLHMLRPIDGDEWNEAGKFGKLYCIVKAPIAVVLKLSIPLAQARWSKLLTLIHCFLSPLALLACFQVLDFRFVDGFPQLYILALGFGAVLFAVVVVFTRFDATPRFYKVIVTYVGFVLATAWIYAIAAEVVDVVAMLGVISKVSHEVLGLTILAWCNSIGDLIADTSAARKGMSKMAISAAFAGPLFNLLIGFGLPFTIAVFRDSSIKLAINSVTKVLIAGLAVSLFSSLILLPVQKFYARRWYAVWLLLVYVAFLVFVILAELKVVKF